MMHDILVVGVQLVAIVSGIMMNRRNIREMRTELDGCFDTMYMGLHRVDSRLDKIVAYSDKVIDHYSNPRNVGQMDKASTEVGTGLVGAPECGDVMRLQIRVNPETQVIEDAKFKTFGCGSAIASSSLATEWVKGKTISEALTISNTDIVKELALPPVKIHCSVLAEDAIRAAIGDWKKKNHVAEGAEVAMAAAAH